MSRKNVFTFLILTICIGAGIQHWFSVKKPIQKEPPTERIFPAPSKIADKTTSQGKAITSSTPTAPIQPVLEPRSTLQHIYELMGTHSLEQSLELATALVTQLELHAQTDDLGYAYLARGEVYEELKRKEDAIADFEHVYHLWRDDTPDSGRGWLRVYDALTRSYARAARWSETLAMANRGLKTAAVTPSGGHSYEIRFHQRKIEALIALHQGPEAEESADVFRRQVPALLADDASMRARWFGWLAGCYRKLGSSEKQLAVLSEAANNLPDDKEKPSTLTEFERNLSFAETALAAGNKADANRRADTLRDALRTLNNPDDTIEAMIKLYGFFDNADRYEDGLALAQEAADRQAKSAKVNSKTQRRILRSINRFLSTLCRFDEATKIANKTLEFDRKEFGEDSAEYLRDLNSLGHDLYFMGDYKGAIVLARDALARAERLQPPDENLTESALGVIGFIITQSNEGSPAEAEAALRRAIDLNEKRNGQLDQSSADDRINLATALMQLNRLDDAQCSLEKVFACFKASNALDSDLAGWAFCQESSLFEKKKEWEKALIAARHAVEIRERIYGLQNFRTRIMLRQYVDVAWQAGDKKGCVERAEQLLTSALNDHGWSEARDIQLCVQLAKWHRELGNNKRAQELSAMIEHHSDKGK